MRHRNEYSTPPKLKITQVNQTEDSQTCTRLPAPGTKDQLLNKNLRDTVGFINHTAGASRAEPYEYSKVGESSLHCRAFQVSDESRGR